MMLKTLLVILGISCAIASSAKTLPKVDVPVQGYVFVNNNSASISATNPVTRSAQLATLENWASYTNSGSKFYSFSNTLELRQIETTDLPVIFEYKLVVSGTLKMFTIGSSGFVSTSVSLEINYDPTTQKTCRQSDYVSYSNAYLSEFSIESVVLTSGGLPAPPALYIDVSKIVELNFGSQGTMYSAPVFATTPLLHSNCVDHVTNELVVSWSQVAFAEEYELEITFKDNYTNNINTALPASAITYDFKENSTRIVTKQNYYRIPLVYERGYLLYRVRAIGVGGDNWDKRIPCKWSALPTGTVSSFPNKYGPIPSHVADRINWQLSTTYSDEGKRKDVVQYYDGLSMSRQTVTGVSQARNMFTQNVMDNLMPVVTPPDNLEILQMATEVEDVEMQSGGLRIPSGGMDRSPGGGGTIAPSILPIGCASYGREKIKEIIAQEVIYDFNGRPALQILPVPTGTHKITYIKKLNKNLAGVSYTWKDFDTIKDCLLTAHPLSSNASGYALGAGAYYSPNNPNKLGYNAFIPDSKGYPFSRVQYTFDNTGKTFRQAGVGAIHTLDIDPPLPGHETRFYYGKPNQPELDRMFGNEVGYCERYQKNMVVDPNGQVSVSYLNPEGKTIATALTGLRPDNLIAPDNESNPEVTINVDLLSSNTINTLEHTLTVNEQFVVAAEAVYNFDYTVQGEKLTYAYCEENNICLDCIYDLDIRLISNEACADTPFFFFRGTFGDLIKLEEEQPVNIDLKCFDSQLSGYVDKPRKFPTPFSRTLPAGSYTLVKTLKVNTAAAEAYVKLVFKDTCTSVLQGFLDTQIDLIDTMGCYQSCSTCKDSNALTPENCDAQCPEPMNECERAKYMMLVDMSPGGQYAQYKLTATGYDASTFPLSIFNPANQWGIDWTTIAGVYPAGATPPTLDSLINHWDKETTPLLFLPYHPEYCMLKWCGEKNYGKDYDLELNVVLTHQEALDSGLLIATSTDSAYEQLFDNDPYFKDQTTGVTTALGNEFRHFLAHPCGGGVSLDILAMDMAYCQAQAAAYLLSLPPENPPNIDEAVTPATPPCLIPVGYHDPTNTAAYHEFGSDPLTRDYEWVILRNLYLTYKEKYLYESRRDYSIANGCFNGCIGDLNFWFGNWPIDGIHSGQSWSAEGNIPGNYSDPCGNFHSQYYYKVKRFTNRYDAASQTTINTPINFSGINLYDQCPSPSTISNLQAQAGAIISEYVCDSSKGAVAVKDSCWSTVLVSLLNQHLPSAASAPVTITASDPGHTLESIALSTGLPLNEIKIEYVASTHQYRISLLANRDRSCQITFSATLDKTGAPIPVSGVCCPHTADQNNRYLTLLFADNTTSVVKLSATCKLPPCPEPVMGLPADSCTMKTPFAHELLSFLRHLNDSGAKRSGLFNSEANSSQIEHLMDPFGPTYYAFDQTNCSLTLSTVPPQTTGGGRRSVNADPSDENPRGRYQTKMHEAPKKPLPCTITFSGCDWMNANATLLSLRPYFPNGIASSITNQFVLTYCTGSRPDTFSVIGNSGCFPINDCDSPYFCPDDTIPIYHPKGYNACVESKILTAKFIAYSNYGKWLDSMKSDLLDKYYRACMKPKEKIIYDYPDRQFHYTLYYYDQAGNLVRTVPPAGVVLLSPTLSPQIKIDRDNHNISGTAGITAHTLVTNYKYNSLNQNVWQITPDAGRTDFRYDRLGRIVASQNAKQIINNEYSYSYYDKLGRIVEGGQIRLQPTSTLYLPAVANYNGWKQYLYNHPSIIARTEITFTQYDQPFPNTGSSVIPLKFGTYGQQNLRGRVASILSFDDKLKQLAGNFRHGTHYTYDVTGNVPIVLQDFPSMPFGVKAIAYNFDLLTGKVNEVRYQPGLQDEFRHKYLYDDELRLRKVQTSKKGIFWETEAEYFYYKHGPLARTELGQLKVQGLDYIYTLQGWIKGVNGTTQERTEDAGRDGIALNDPKTITVQINGQPVTTTVETSPTYNSTGSGYHSLHTSVAADAFGYVLGYYNDANHPDYVPIDATVSTTTTMDASSIGDVKPLYNGNISRMYTWLQGQDMGGLGMNYRYDQLNRLKSQEGFTITGASQSLMQDEAYLMNLTYDANGNIMSLFRNGRIGNAPMDALSYNYYGNSNKLEYVKDDGDITNNYPEVSPPPVNGTVTDIDAQLPGNYTYDEIGNLIKDNSEKISLIAWNLQNKITQIKKIDLTNIYFAYDAMGNRVYKNYYAGSAAPNPNPYPTETYYVRDAQGNIMATYEVKGNDIYWQEQTLYGSSRLGVWHPGIIISPTTQGLTGTIDWQNIK